MADALRVERPRGFQGTLVPDFAVFFHQKSTNELFVGRKILENEYWHKAGDEEWAWWEEHSKATGAHIRYVPVSKLPVAETKDVDGDHREAIAYNRGGEVISTIRLPPIQAIPSDPIVLTRLTLLEKRVNELEKRQSEDSYYVLLSEEKYKSILNDLDNLALLVDSGVLRNVISKLQGLERVPRSGV